MSEGLLVAVVCAALLAQALILLLKPSLWVTWLVARPWKSFGVDVKIVDEARLKRQARWLGLLLLALLAVVVYLYNWFCGTRACQP